MIIAAGKGCRATKKEEYNSGEPQIFLRPSSLSIKEWQMESLNLSTFLSFNRILKFHLIRRSWNSPVFRFRVIYITLKIQRIMGVRKMLEHQSSSYCKWSEGQYIIWNQERYSSQSSNHSSENFANGKQLYQCQGTFNFTKMNRNAIISYGLPEKAAQKISTHFLVHTIYFSYWLKLYPL